MLVATQGPILPSSGSPNGVSTAPETNRTALSRSSPVSNTRRRQTVQCTCRLQISGATTPTRSSGLLPNDAAAETSPSFLADICTCGRSPNSLGQRRASPHQRRPPTSSDTPGERDLLLFLLVQENHLSPLRRASRRTAPSGGRLYPLTLYVIASQAVGGITPGPYKYLPDCHALLPIGPQCPPQQGEVNDKVCDDEGGDPEVLQKLLRSTVPQVAQLKHQSWMDAAGAVFLISGNPAVNKSHGGLYERFGEDLVKFEAGCAAENLALQATALGLGATFVGAFEASEVKDAIASRDEGEVPLLMMAVGVPKGSLREHHEGLGGAIPLDK